MYKASMSDPRSSGDAPLAGKTVVLVHPAWHSCGSHQVFLSQARTYRALGARLVAVALNDIPATTKGKQRRDYLDKTRDLVADTREWSAMAPWSIADRAFGNALRRRLHGDHATLRIAVAARTPIPASVEALDRIDLVHCNHFFCMPIATRIATLSSAPILLDSHDVQARQYQLANAAGWTLPPTVSYDDMLATELAVMERADLIVHLNADEDAAFRDLLPRKHHALLYPTVASIDWQPGGRDFLVVAAANRPNIESVEWLLRDVAPLAPDIPFRIVGSVGSGLRRQAPALFKRHAALFTERVEDIQAAYRQAAAIVLPTISGHGISIKTIEALSSGAPLVATPHAFRGMRVDSAALSNVRLASDAAGFAAALLATRDSMAIAPAETSDTRRLYETLFAPAAYRTQLADLAMSLMASRAEAVS